MRGGDLLEILGAACLVGVAYGYLGWRLALAVLGVALIYEGQCFAHTTVALPRVRLTRFAGRLGRSGGDE